jgi:hypothetical protein
MSFEGLVGVKTRGIRSVLLAALACALVLSASDRAFATGITCGSEGQLCSISLSIGSDMVAQGTYSVDPDTGEISLAQPVEGQSGENTISVDSLFGNADPILGFAVAAGTGAGANAFSITLNLPIALSGMLNASSSVSYSLTATTAAGAQIAPLIGSHVVIAQEVDTSVGGLAALNKGVDVGNTFSFLGGPQVQNSPVYTASNSFMGNLAYDLMSVTIAFSLSANSNVGISGFVQQVPVPEPSTLLLVGSGLLGLVAFGRKRSA